MDKHKISTNWLQNMSFESDIDGHKIRVDAPLTGGGDNSGPSPKKLMLAALSGCTGMDVVSILKKMHVDITSCSIEVEGWLEDEHPRFYNKMHVTYIFRGKNLPKEKLEKAVKMSEETYCGVRALYAKAIEVTSSIVVEE